MHATTIAVRVADGAYPYAAGALLSDDGCVLWQCAHAHPVTVYSLTSSVALDCAIFEHTRRMRNEGR